MTGPRVTYSFGPLERRGLLGPLRAGQALIMALGLVAAIGLLDLDPSPTGALGALLTVAGAGTISFAPVGHSSLQEWLPVAGLYAVRRIGGHDRFRSTAPSLGSVAVIGRRRLGAGAAGYRGPAPQVPPGVRGLRIIETPYRQGTIGALAEQAGRRLTAVLACRVLAFSLLDPEAQERRLARWGLVLSGAAGSAVRRLQWIERTAPAQGDELARWLATERDPTVPLRGTPMLESYLELISASTTVTQEHEILLAVQVDGRRSRGRDPAGVQGQLIEATERVSRGLVEAEVDVLGALSPGQLARTLRTAFDPYARAEIVREDAVESARNGLTETNAWPMGTRERWDHYQTDGALHASYWISGWPRVEISPMFMDALLGRSSAVRTVTVTFEPLTVERSTREVEAAITRDQADRALRHRFGQSETARQRQTRAATIRREAELAAGHGEVRLSGFITVSGRDAEDLRRSCAEIHDHAARARLELHRLYGQQADAFTFTLPLCRGLR